MTIGLIGFVSAAEQEVPSDSNSIKAGAWALQFGIGSNFTFTAFQGTTISLLHHLSDANAIRAGLSFSGNFSDGTDLANQVLGDTGHIPSSGDNSTHTMNLTLGVQCLWYLNSRSPVHLYVGLGPSVSYYYYSYRNAQVAVPPNSYLYYSNYEWTQADYVYTNKQLSVGARGLVGVEWFPSRWFSLHAEYSQTIQYGWGSTKTTTDGVPYNIDVAKLTVTDNGSSKGWNITSGYISLGASIYF